MRDIEQEVIVLKGEVTNLSNKVNPLQAINELVWRKKSKEELEAQVAADPENVLRA